MPDGTAPSRDPGHRGNNLGVFRRHGLAALTGACLPHHPWSWGTEELVRKSLDNNPSAWQRNRNLPGWNASLDTIRSGQLRHLIVYHPDRLMRQPRDLEELFTLSEEHDITLHGQANRPGSVRFG
jgi:hypothetical protein